MSGDVYVVTSGKGGVGKTTTAVNLAVALRQYGHSVAVLDADLGMPNVSAFLSLDAEPTLHDVLAERATTSEAISEVGPGLGFVLGDRSLEGFADADPARLGAVVDELAERYQYVLVDTGGGLSYEGVYPMELADRILLVTSPVPAAITDTEKSKQLAERIGVPVRGVVVTHATGDTRPESIASELDVDFLGSVPTDDAITESATKRQPVVAYAPESPASIAYYRIAQRLSDPSDTPLEPLDTATKPPDVDSTTPAASDADGSTAQRRSEPSADGSDQSSTRAQSDDDRGAPKSSNTATTDAEPAKETDRTESTGPTSPTDASPSIEDHDDGAKTEPTPRPNGSPPSEQDTTDSGLLARLLDRFR